MSEKSVAEIGLMQLYKEMLAYPFISIEDFKKFESRLSSLLVKCEELRKQRDNWREKYDNLKKETTC